jgi:hypothetical protein
MEYTKSQRIALDTFLVCRFSEKSFDQILEELKNDNLEDTTPRAQYKNLSGFKLWLAVSELEIKIRVWE